MVNEPLAQKFQRFIRRRQRRSSASANAPPGQDFVFRTPGCARLPVFLPRSMEGEWSAGRRPGGLRDLLGRVCETQPHAKLPGPKSLEGGGGPGARGPLRGARAPLGAPSRHALSAAAPCAVIRHRDRRRRQTSKAWRSYNAGKTNPDCCEFGCEFTGDGGCSLPPARSLPASP